MTLPEGFTKHHTFDGTGACVGVRYEDGKGGYMEANAPPYEPFPDRFYKMNGRNGQVVTAGQLAKDVKEFAVKELAAALMRAGYH